MTRKLLFLNGIAIIFAVYHHSIYWAVTAINYWGDRFISSATPELLSIPNVFSLFLRITDQIAGSAVPAFLFVSGFLYSFSLDRQTIRQSYRLIQKRILYLLFPYIVWSTATVVFRAIEGRSYTVVELIRVYLLGEADAPFYYVPLIIQMIILSPFLFKAVKKYPVVILPIAFVIQALSSIPWYFKVLEITPLQSLNFLNFFKSSYLFSYLVWFIMGMVFFTHREKITAFLRIYRWGLLSSLLFLLILGQFEIQYIMNASGNSWINSQSSIITKWLYSLLIFSFTILLEKITPSSTIEFIGGKSYGIYLSHIITIEIFARSIYHLLPFILGQTVIFLGILVFLGVGTPLLIMYVSRITPLKTIYSYLWG